MSAVPPELKPINAFVQRASELKGRDEVMRYWCNYHAAQQAMNLSPESDTARAFMIQLLDQLESASRSLLLYKQGLVKQNKARAALTDNEAVTVAIAGQAYVQNFCDKVFAAADNEDRAGKATRTTAKSFLAAANFFEVLSSFGELDSDAAAKVKYAKWKAADIAKAIKEGRQPTAGPADQPEAAADVLMDEDKEVEAQLLKLQQSTLPTNAPSDEQSVSDAINVDAGRSMSPAYPFPAVPPTSMDPTAPTAMDLSDTPSVSLAPPTGDLSTAFPSIVLPTAPTIVMPVEDPSNDFPLASPLPPSAHIPSAPDPGQISRFATPLNGPSASALITPALGSTPSQPPPAPNHQRLYDMTSAPTFQAPAPPLLEKTYDANIVSQTQKHCRFAVSALNYDDFAEARKQLRAALKLLDG